MRENYLDPDGLPIKEWHRPRRETVDKRIKQGWSEEQAHQKTLRHLSLRRFEKMLGVAPSERSSGRLRKRKLKVGQACVENHQERWIYTRVEVVGFKTHLWY